MTATLEQYLSDPALGLVRSVRPAQLRMAQFVTDIIENGGIAMLEAGTGTGKSFGYGLPAVLSDKRVVISVSKKSLQGQLVDKDLPHLVRATRPVGFSLLKGKRNYPCTLRWEELKTSPAFGNVPTEEAERFAEWLLQPGVRDLAGWNFPWLREVQVNECVRNHCPHSDGCSYVQQRDAAQLSRILVVNHAMLAFDLAMGGGKLLPKYDVLIIDEAHQAPQFFRDAYSIDISPRHPMMIAQLLKDSDFEVGDDFVRFCEGVFSMIPSRAEELSIDAGMEHLFGKLLAKAGDIHGRMTATGILGEDDGSSAPASGLQARLRAKIRAGGQMIGQVKRLCEIILQVPPNPDATTRVDKLAPNEWLVYTEKVRDDTHLIATPLEVGPLVAPALLGIGRVIATSATLGGGKVGFMAREYGLKEAQIRIQETLPSPFDYERRSLLYVSRTAPDPADRSVNYYEKMADEVHELLYASRGGALVLCASTDDMKFLHDEIYKRHFRNKGMNYKLAMQEPGFSFDAVLEWFKSDKSSAFIGLKTFWEGVDIPGDGLRLVVIPRLPFPNRGDAVISARKKRYIEALTDSGVEDGEAGYRAWNSFDLQIALMDVAQGAGRLIRTETDAGVVAILDTRVYGKNKPYGATIRKSLPHKLFTGDKALLLRILNGFGAKALGPAT